MLSTKRPLGKRRRALVLMAATFLVWFFGGLPLDADQEESGAVHAAPASPATEPPEAEPQRRFPRPSRNGSPELSPKQQRDLLKHNFDKMKQDADDLADLARSLQEDLNASNENVLSIEVVEKAEKIEKLAKKIKRAAKGF